MSIKPAGSQPIDSSLPLVQQQSPVASKAVEAAVEAPKKVAPANFVPRCAVVAKKPAAADASDKDADKDANDKDGDKELGDKPKKVAPANFVPRCAQTTPKQSPAKSTADDDANAAIVEAKPQRLASVQ